jgi:hypothetical protein
LSDLREVFSLWIRSAIGSTGLLTCFTAITMDSWSEVMWWTMDGYQPVAGGVFFIAMMVRVFGVLFSYLLAESEIYFNHFLIEYIQPSLRQ